MPSGARLTRVATLLAACGLLSACGSTASSDRSALQQKIGTPGGISATELRLRLYELPQQLGGIVEIAGRPDPRELLRSRRSAPRPSLGSGRNPGPLRRGPPSGPPRGRPRPRGVRLPDGGLPRGGSRKRRLRPPAGDRRRCGPADGEAHRKHGFLSLHRSSGLPPATGQAPGVRPRTPDRRVLPGTRDRHLRARPLFPGRERRSARRGRPGHGHSGRHLPAAERLHHASAQGDAVAGGARRGRHCGPRQPGRHSRRRPCHRRRPRAARTRCSPTCPEPCAKRASPSSRLLDEQRTELLAAVERGTSRHDRIHHGGARGGARRARRRAPGRHGEHFRGARGRPGRARRSDQANHRRRFRPGARHGAQRLLGSADADRRVGPAVRRGLSSRARAADG